MFRTDPTDGNGSGLAIVHRIVAAHGWTVTAGESESGALRDPIPSGVAAGVRREATVQGGTGVDSTTTPSSTTRLYAASSSFQRISTRSKVRRSP